MTFPTVFANLAAGNQPASLLDAMFNILGASATIPCTVTGTNAITATPITNYYLPGAYANFQSLSFVAAASATGAVTIRLGALAFVNLYMPSGLQANSGDIISGNFYVCAFNAALNAGNGGFQVFNASTPSVIQPIAGTFKNLKITNGGTPDTQVAVTADQVMLQTAGGGAARVTSVAVTISTGTNGANGLDAGTVAAATFYSVWVIYNGSTIAGLLSLSATSPTLPSGYIYYARVGWVVTGAISTNLNRTLQLGKDAQYVVTPTTPTANLPVVAQNGTITTPWQTYSVTAVVPSTAARIRLQSALQGSVNNSSTGILIAPNNNYGTTPGTAPYPVYAKEVTLGSLAGNTFYFNDIIDMVLESTNIYAGTLGSVTLAQIQCLGWVDNI